MGMHTPLRADDAFHVGGPAKPGRVDQALYPAFPGPYDIDLDAADVAVFGGINRSEKWIGHMGRILPDATDRSGIRASEGMPPDRSSRPASARDSCKCCSDRRLRSSRQS